MTTTPDEDATTWRDLQHELTEDQIAWVEDFERTALGDPADVAELLLDKAREHARGNLTDRMMFGQVPAPSGAVRIWHWESDDDGQWSRAFDGTSRDYRGFDISIDGRQYPDGSVFRTVSVHADERVSFDVDGAREMARLLSEAADEIANLSR